jgi:hypothetical protein
MSVPTDYHGNLLPFRGGATILTGGALLAVNPNAIVAVTSGWSREDKQHFLRLHLANSFRVSIREEDAEQVLGLLGLGELVEEGWTLALERDLA